MIWQPTMRVWAGDQVKIDERELESDAMEGVESTTEVPAPAPVPAIVALPPVEVTEVVAASGSGSS